jgi:hypothetical protein
LVDKRLSLKAKGLWAYMLSKPPGWNFAASRISWETKDKEKSIYAAWDELEYAGYLKRWRSPDGRMQYKLYDQQHGPKAPYEGDYDFEFSEEFSPWRDDCPTTLNTECPDAACTKERFADHLIFAHGLEDSEARHEAEEWAKASKEGKVAMIWRSACKWAELRLS